MTGFDYAVLVIMGFSILLSFMRGLTQEILSLLAWVAALWCASQYADLLSPSIPGQLSPELALLVAFVAILIAVWLAGILVKMAVGQFIRMTGLGVADRIFGVFFGAARGAVVILVLVLAAGLTKFPQLPMWRDALFSEMCVSVALEALPWLPPTLAEKIHY